jgi:hypothetical protein
MSYGALVENAIQAAGGMGAERNLSDVILAQGRANLDAERWKAQMKLQEAELALRKKTQEDRAQMDRLTYLQNLGAAGINVNPSDAAAFLSTGTAPVGLATASRTNAEVYQSLFPTPRATASPTEKIYGLNNIGQRMLL